MITKGTLIAIKTRLEAGDLWVKNRTQAEVRIANWGPPYLGRDFFINEEKHGSMMLFSLDAPEGYEEGLVFSGTGDAKNWSQVSLASCFMN